MTANEQITDVEQKLLDGITTLHEQLLEANEQAAERLQEIQFPGAGVEPPIKPAEAVAHYYDFAGRLLDANRTFAEKLVATWYPAPKKEPAPKSPKAK